MSSDSLPGVTSGQAAEPTFIQFDDNSLLPLLYGGYRPEPPAGLDQGYFVRPTVFHRVSSVSPVLPLSDGATPT